MSSALSGMSEKKIAFKEATLSFAVREQPELVLN